ncbi:Phosphohistidine phosphatase SixA [Aquicella siphonis]|uniref:Phosphohistidine phosphatase SixA n=1 Tax=Aquicella siphonis TaxID=254247 RepID=A0A5E4PJ10_9COXI|nr:phosphohistidine phosphatase SixA [Aquicella siphonis]VVC77059.1 Phosphohistidine phosphatase SixA [Aquicella siphonis]
MKLYLMRHGDYLMDTNQRMDVLSDAGKREVMNIANFLIPSQLRVSNILHSGKFRAQQTAELISQGIQSDQLPQAHAGLKPEDDVIAFANEISQWSDDVLVVGHLPFMGRLTGKLLTGNENREVIHFDPGTLVCLEQYDTDRWMVDWVLCPRMFV